MEKHNSQIIEEIVFTSDGSSYKKQYRKGLFLGKGGFAHVYELTSLETNKKYAGKIIAKSTLTRSKSKQKLISEIKIHRSVSHPHIVKFEHFFEDEDNVYILIEMCENETMVELINKRRNLHELEAKCYLKQVVSALLYLHGKGVIHRDLKIGNLFLSSNMQVKIGDFGLATKLEKDGKRYSVCGTPNYIAPEVLDGKIGYAYKIDVWSLGVVLYTWLLGNPPFETNKIKKTYEMIKSGNYSYPKGMELSQEAVDLIDRTLQVDSSKRISLKEMLEHGFLSGNNRIPEILPTSALTVPLSEGYISQFMPEIVPLKLYYSKTNVRLSSLTRELTRVKTARKFVARNILDIQQCVLVKKWVDFSVKYGLGYILSNGDLGVYFNDQTSILGSSHLEILYIESNILSRHNINEFTPELSKKNSIYKHFLSYINKEIANVEKIKLEKRIVYVKSWIKSSRAILFRFSNKTTQICFRDDSEIILFDKERMAIFIDKTNSKSIMTIEELVHGEIKILAKRVEITRSLLTLLSKQDN